MSLEMTPFDRPRRPTSSYSSFIVTMALSCIISERKRDIGRKSQFFSYPFYITPHGKKVTTNFALFLS